MTTTIIIGMALLIVIAYAAFLIKARDNNRLREQVHELSKIELVANTINDNCRYIIAKAPWGYEVLKTHPLYPNTTIVVKSFCDEDRDYARRCAEELCDKLNETI